MAKIIKRTRSSRGTLGRKVKHVAYGYHLMGPKGLERKISSDCLTEADARAALSARQTEIAAGHSEPPAEPTLGPVVEEHLAYKRESGPSRMTSAS